MCLPGRGFVVGRYVPFWLGVEGSYVPFWYGVVGRQLRAILLGVWF
jgi:hypothetical protein